MSAKADLSLHWAQRSLCWFCHEAAHLLSTLNNSSANILNVLSGDVIQSEHKGSSMAPVNCHIDVSFSFS